MPRSTTTLFRTLVTLVGTLELMSPGYALKEAIQRVGGEVMAPMMRPENLRELVQHEVFSVAPVLARLPRDIDDVARSLLRGDLRTRISLFSEPADLRAARAMLNRLVMGVVGSALAIASAILLTLEPRSGQGAELITIIGGIGLTFSVVLLLRVVVQILRERG
jgi:ubiquinone biosynthesis protein